MAFLVQRLRPTTAAATANGPSTPALRVGLLGGAAAAGAGLGAIALPLFLLWIVSPYVESGGGGVLHLAACLWLLAHGTTLRFGETPVGVPPLLLTSLALLLLYRTSVRAARQATAAERAAGQSAGQSVEWLEDQEDVEEEEFESERAAGPAASRLGSLLAGLCAGYLLVGAVAVLLAAGTGEVPDVSPAAALGRLVLAVLPVAALGVRVGAGPGRLPALPRLQLPPWARPLPRWGSRVLDAVWVPGGGAAALRAGAGAGLALLGGGALLFALSLLPRFGAAGAVSAQLAPDLVGRFALLLLCAVLLPNAAVWAGAYALGPGFVLGGRFAPLTAPAVQPPAFPLLAALPGAGHSPLGLFTQAVPLLAGGVAAGMLGRAAQDWGVLATVRAAVAAAVCAGAPVTLCAAASGGPLGVAALAEVGPSPWSTGLAALAWTLLVCVPGALLVRWYRGRPAGWPPVPGSGWRISRRTSPASAAVAVKRWWRRCCRRPE